jgi:hypothetical protein
VFTSFELINWISDTSPDFTYLLIDDQFGKVSGIGPAPYPAMRYNPTPHPSPGPIILEYGHRNLNIEGNIALYFLQQCQECDWKLKYILQWCNERCCDPKNSKFAKLWQTVDQSKILKYAVFI